jgi:hypothetical protein
MSQLESVPIQTNLEPGAIESVSKFDIKRYAAMAAAGAIAFSASTSDKASAGIPVNPASIAEQVDQIIYPTIDAWADHQTPDGDFIDPVAGRVGGYGVGMIGQAMVEVGSAKRDSALIKNGLQALIKETQTPNHGGFERFSLASAYSWDQKHLTNNPDWQAARPVIGNFLKSQKEYKVGQKAVDCYANPHCYTNLKLVRSFAEVELIAAGDSNSLISGAQASSKKAALKKDVRGFMSQAVGNTSSDGRLISYQGHFSGAGILSDPPRNPLAYHNLSAMLLGRISEDLGPSRTPRGIKQAFMRSAKSIVGFMAPDGDVAFIGRGQGQLWNVAAAADALAVAAKETNNSIWRGRFLAGAETAISRLQNVFTPGEWGMPLVPRLLGVKNPNYAGIDGYANSIEYNGLALWALKNAAEDLRATKSAPSEYIASGANGVFLDPSHAKFATVRKGDLWYAIHASDTHEDARYDFGIVAAERKANGNWKPAIPYRPLTEQQTTAGPVLISGGKKRVPVSEKIEAKPSGLVKVRGGWSTKTNGVPASSTRTSFVFKPILNKGVELSFKTPKKGLYEFMAWFAPGSKLSVSHNNLEVTEPNGRHEKYVFNVPVKIGPGPVYHSAYDENLDSTTLTVKVPKHRLVKFKTLF